jgi:hypothetical protein
MEPFPILAETFRVLKEAEVFLPPAHLATELEDGSIGVYGRLFAEKVEGDLGAIHDDEHLPER